MQKLHLCFTLLLCLTPVSFILVRRVMSQGLYQVLQSGKSK